MRRAERARERNEEKNWISLNWEFVLCVNRIVAQNFCFPSVFSCVNMPKQSAIYALHAYVTVLNAHRSLSHLKIALFARKKAKIFFHKTKRANTEDLRKRKDLKLMTLQYSVYARVCVFFYFLLSRLLFIASKCRWMHFAKYRCKFLWYAYYFTIHAQNSSKQTGSHEWKKKLYNNLKFPLNLFPFSSI